MQIYYKISFFIYFSGVQISLEDIHKYKKLDFLARKAVEGFITGLHKSPYHGFSVEFAEHTPYNPGSSIKHIDWKLYARTDKLYTKKYEEETNLRCRILLDTSSSMFYPNESRGKITYAAFCAAALIALLSKQRDACGLSLFDNEIQEHTACKSTTAHTHYLTSLLNNLLTQSIPKGKDTNIANTLHEIAAKAHKRSLIILFSDMFDSAENNSLLFSALRHLKHNKHEIIVFHLVDKKTEIDFNFEKRPYKFIDLETNKSVKVSPHLVKDTYSKVVSSYFDEIKLKCAEYKIEFHTISTDQSIDRILLPILAKRKKMRA